MPSAASAFENPLPAQVLSYALGEAPIASSSSSQQEQDPPFSLGQVQYTPPSAIKSLSVQSNLLLLLTATSIVLIDLSKPSQEESLPAPWTIPPEASQLSTFVDPLAQHVLISVHATGENFYLPLKPAAGKTKQVKPLSKLRGVNITAVSWSDHHQQHSVEPSSTGNLLLGTDEGKLIATCLDAESTSRGLPPFKSTERFVRHLTLQFDLAPITGLRYLSWEKDRKAGLLVATASKLWQCVARVTPGREDGYDALDKVYRDGHRQAKCMELPSDTESVGALHFAVHADQLSVAWHASPGIYYGNVSLDKQDPGDSLISDPRLIPYPPSSPSSADDRATPLSISLTPFHFILLYASQLRVIRILDDAPVYADQVSDNNNNNNEEHQYRLAKDEHKGTYWIYSPSSIFELTVSHEQRDIWRVYLSQKNFGQALVYVNNEKERDTVQRAQADALLAMGRELQAADLYAHTAKAFEEVVLLLAGQDDALRAYLAAKLDVLPKSMKSARMALATWLLATYLAKLNALEDALYSESDQELKSNLQVESDIIYSDVQTFLKKFTGDLDRRTTLELVRTHGRTDILLEYARLVSDHALVMQHYLEEEDWPNALKTLAVTNNLELYYTHAHELLCNAPSDTIQQFMRRPELDVARLLPALLLPSHPDASSEIKKYLTWAVSRDDPTTTESSIHNTLLALHVADGTELAFLEADNPGYDLEHALRLCLSSKRTQACTVIFGKMQMYESAVDLALDSGDLNLAKTYADKAAEQDDEMLRKKLWRKIAGKLVQERHDISEAMRFLDTDALKIEDILPFFPDFVLIDSFKDDICEALESYADRIEGLKSEMNEATASAEVIKRDIAELSHRLVVVDSSDKCCVCQALLLKRQFYVFPCGHSFHADCLISEVTQHLSATQLKRVLHLQDRLRRLQKALIQPASGDTSLPPPPEEFSGLLKPLPPFARNKLTTASLQSMDQLRKLVIPDALVGAIGAGFEGMKMWTEQVQAQGGGGGASKETDELTKVREALDDILASSCVWCESGIAAIDQGFLQDGEQDD